MKTKMNYSQKCSSDLARGTWKLYTDSRFAVKMAKYWRDVGGIVTEGWYMEDVRMLSVKLDGLHFLYGKILYKHAMGHSIPECEESSDNLMARNKYV